LFGEMLVRSTETGGLGFHVCSMRAAGVQYSVQEAHVLWRADTLIPFRYTYQLPRCANVLSNI